MASGPITSQKTEGRKVEAVTDFLFLDSKIIADTDCSHEIKKNNNTCSMEGKPWQARQNIKKQRHHFAEKGLFSQIYGFSSGQVWM